MNQKQEQSFYHLRNKFDTAKAYDEYVIDNNLEHTRNFNE